MTPHLPVLLVRRCYYAVVLLLPTLKIPEKLQVFQLSPRIQQGFSGDEDGILLDCVCFSSSLQAIEHQQHGGDDGVCESVAAAAATNAATDGATVDATTTADESHDLSHQQW